MKKTWKIMTVVLSLMILVGVSPALAATVPEEFPPMEMVASDFTITSNEAKALTLETAKDSFHGDVHFINQMFMIDLSGMIEADEEELLAINSGEEGIYPLTFSVDFNEEVYSATVQVTIIDNMGLSLLWIPIVVYLVAAVIVGIVYFIGEKRKKRNK